MLHPRCWGPSFPLSEKFIKQRVSLPKSLYFGYANSHITINREETTVDVQDEHGRVSLASRCGKKLEGAFDGGVLTSLPVRLPASAGQAGTQVTVAPCCFGKWKQAQAFCLGWLTRSSDPSNKRLKGWSGHSCLLTYIKPNPVSKHATSRRRLPHWKKDGAPHLHTRFLNGSTGHWAVVGMIDS